MNDLSLKCWEIATHALFFISTQVATAMVASWLRHSAAGDKVASSLLGSRDCILVWWGYRSMLEEVCFQVHLKITPDGQN